MKPISDKDYQDVMAKINALEDYVQDLDIEGFAIRIRAFLAHAIFKHRFNPSDVTKNRLQRLHRMACYLNKFKKLAAKDIEIMEAINSELPD